MGGGMEDAARMSNKKSSSMSVPSTPACQKATTTAQSTERLQSGKHIFPPVSIQHQQKRNAGGH